MPNDIYYPLVSGRMFTWSEAISSGRFLPTAWLKRNNDPDKQQIAIGMDAPSLYIANPQVVSLHVLADTNPQSVGDMSSWGLSVYATRSRHIGGASKSLGEQIQLWPRGATPKPIVSLRFTFAVQSYFVELPVTLALLPKGSNNALSYDTLTIGRCILSGDSTTNAHASIAHVMANFLETLALHYQLATRDEAVLSNIVEMAATPNTVAKDAFKAFAHQKPRAFYGAIEQWAGLFEASVCRITKTDVFKVLLKMPENPKYLELGARFLLMMQAFPQHIKLRIWGLAGEHDMSVSFQPSECQSIPQNSALDAALQRGRSPWPKKTCFAGMAHANPLYSDIYLRRSKNDESTERWQLYFELAGRMLIRQQINETTNQWVLGAQLPTGPWASPQRCQFCHVGLREPLYTCGQDCPAWECSRRLSPQQCNGGVACKCKGSPTASTSADTPTASANSHVGRRARSGLVARMAEQGGTTAGARANMREEPSTDAAQVLELDNGEAQRVHTAEASEQDGEMSSAGAAETLEPAAAETLEPAAGETLEPAAGEARSTHAEVEPIDAEEPPAAEGSEQNGEVSSAGAAETPGLDAGEARFASAEGEPTAAEEPSVGLRPAIRAPSPLHWSEEEDYELASTDGGEVAALEDPADGREAGDASPTRAVEARPEASSPSPTDADKQQRFLLLCNTLSRDVVDEIGHRPFCFDAVYLSARNGGSTPLQTLFEMREIVLPQREGQGALRPAEQQRYIDYFGYGVIVLDPHELPCGQVRVHDLTALPDLADQGAGAQRTYVVMILKEPRHAIHYCPFASPDEMEYRTYLRSEIADLLSEQVHVEPQWLEVAPNRVLGMPLIQELTPEGEPKAQLDPSADYTQRGPATEMSYSSDMIRGLQAEPTHATLLTTINDVPTLMHLITVLNAQIKEVQLQVVGHKDACAVSPIYTDDDPVRELEKLPPPDIDKSNVMYLRRLHALQLEKLNEAIDRCAAAHPTWPTVRVRMISTWPLKHWFHIVKLIHLAKLLKAQKKARAASTHGSLETSAHTTAGAAAEQAAPVTEGAEALASAPSATAFDTALDRLAGAVAAAQSSVQTDAGAAAVATKEAAATAPTPEPTKPVEVRYPVPMLAELSARVAEGEQATAQLRTLINQTLDAHAAMRREMTLGQESLVEQVHKIGEVLNSIAAGSRDANDLQPRHITFGADVDDHLPRTEGGDGRTYADGGIGGGKGRGKGVGTTGRQAGGRGAGSSGQGSNLITRASPSANLMRQLAGNDKVTVAPESHGPFDPDANGTGVMFLLTMLHQLIPKKETRVYGHSMQELASPRGSTSLQRILSQSEHEMYLDHEDAADARRSVHRYVQQVFGAVSRELEYEAHVTTSELLQFPGAWAAVAASAQRPRRLMIARVHILSLEEADILIENDEVYQNTFQNVMRSYLGAWWRHRPPNSTQNVSACDLAAGLVAATFREPDEHEVASSLYLLLTSSNATPPLRFGRRTSTGAHGGGGGGGGYHSYDHDDSNRPPDLKRALYFQIGLLPDVPLKEWPAKVGMQLWHLNIIQYFTSGAVGIGFQQLLRFGIEQILINVVTLVVDKSQEKFGRLRNLYTAHFDEIMAMTREHAMNVQQTCDEGAEIKQVQHSLVLALCNIFLRLRGIPYGRDVDRMAHAEIKRLTSIQKPPGMPDYEWIEEMRNRLHNWRTLHGAHVSMKLQLELRDFLQIVASQLSNEAAKRRFVDLVGEVVQRWANVLHGGDLSALPGVRDLERTRQVNFGGKAAFAVHVIDNVSDLHVLFEMGSQHLGSGGDGGNTIEEMLRHIVTRWDAEGRNIELLDEKGMAARDVILAVKEDPVACKMFSAMSIRCSMDMDALASADPCPTLGRNCSAPEAEAINAIAADKGTHNTLETEVATDSDSKITAEAFQQLAAQTREAIDNTRAAVETLGTYVQQSTREISHLGLMARTNAENSAGADMRHAVPSTTVPPPSGSGAQAARAARGEAAQIDAIAVDGTATAPAPAPRPQRPRAGERGRKLLDDVRRKNLGANARREQRPAGTPRLRLTDKVPTKFTDIGEDGLAALANEGVNNEADWQQRGPQLCFLCRKQDHYLWHCVKLWATTPAGQQWLGTAKAAEFAGRLKAERGQVFTVREFYDAFCDNNLQADLEAMVDDMAYVCQDCGVNVDDDDASAMPLMMFCEQHDAAVLR